MEIAEEAFSLRGAGAERQALARFRAAYELERAAALAVSAEPSRSVLLRSAATLALAAGEARVAEQLVALGLAADPPEEIAEEMRDLLEDVYLQRHLDLRGLELKPDEVRMSISGDDVGTGLARADRFMRRMDDFSKMIVRTAERSANQPFREAGEPRKTVRDELELYVSSLPPAASLAVAFRLARPKGTEPMWPAVVPHDVVSETLECLQMLENRDDKLVRKRIEDDTYYNNFIALARSIAPDGKSVKVVAFTHVGRSRVLAVPLRRQAKTIKPYVELQQDEEEVVVDGILDFADDRSARRGVVEVAGQKITVAKGTMDDIVRPHWKKRVSVICTRRAGKLYFVDIDRP